MTNPKRRCIALTLACAAALVSSAGTAHAQQPTAPTGITRTELLRQVLPAGDFRNVQAAVLELAPGASAAQHRHDVAVLVYVLEGETENRFNGGTPRVYRAGESWWEAPGTVHDMARNPSTSARARILVVYIGEEGKANTVPMTPARPPTP